MSARVVPLGAFLARLKGPGGCLGALLGHLGALLGRLGTIVGAPSAVVDAAKTKKSLPPGALSAVLREHSWA
eukprot:8545868-Pyramimonas_sp.AAC.1